ncbi:unnamed protein product [Ranitomeya imitator]|uniref:Helix-turn-helix domain-containing protein n=1 Tax=Ranitomeya imitator TaxID=111125 RepID=A0ABN9KSM1_9NEOB|nr:unnamed protein product [Ranitomeya imitator]
MNAVPTSGSNDVSAVDFEESAIYGSLSLFLNNVILWKHYIDDIFSIWGGSFESFIAFHNFLDRSWPGLRFTIAYDQSRINFLDTVVIKNPDGSISTDINTKNTDRNSLLHFDSFHPVSMKSSIPKAQLQRFRRIVSDDTTRDVRVQKMESKFKERGYPQSILNVLDQHILMKHRANLTGLPLSIPITLSHT